MIPNNATKSLPSKKMKKKEREASIKTIKDIAQELSEVYRESIQAHEIHSALDNYKLPELRSALPSLERAYEELNDSELRERADAFTALLEGYREDLKILYTEVNDKLRREVLNSLQAFKIYVNNLSTLTLEDTFSVSKHQEDIITQIRSMSAIQTEIDHLNPQPDTAVFKVTQGLILNEQYLTIEKTYKTALASNLRPLLHQRLVVETLGLEMDDFALGKPKRALNLKIVESLVPPEVVVAVNRDPQNGKFFEYARVASQSSKAHFFRVPAVALAHRSWVTNDKDFVSIDGSSAAEIEIMLTLYGDDQYPTLHSALVAAKALA